MVSVKRDTAAERKALPLATGVLDYFPDALLAVAEVSRVGNDQHNPGQPLHWAKEKSTDEADALMRHFLDRGTLDGDGMRHSAKVAWRALALLQREIEAEVRQPGAVEVIHPFPAECGAVAPYPLSYKSCARPKGHKGIHSTRAAGPYPGMPFVGTVSEGCSFCGVTHGEHVLSCKNWTA